MSVRLDCQCVLLLPLLVLVLAASWAEAAPRPNSAAAQKIKAAYLLNFARLTTWPDDAFADAGDDKAPLVIAVLSAGDADIAAMLLAMLENKLVQSRYVTVRHLTWPDQTKAPDDAKAALAALDDELNQAHMLYVDSSLQKHARGILDRIESDRLLSVSDCADFAAEGGMLGFVRRGDRIVFEANTRAIDRSRVEVSSKVLQLARIVEPKEVQR